MDVANVNEFSSRSHAVVTLRATTFDVVGTSCSVQIFVHAPISLSLFSALGDVMNALTEPRGATKRHIVYRSSKLIRYVISNAIVMARSMRT